ncbi:MAG: tetraacyldisaccharide 4'-kinase [Deltaproteobacteria bacterium]|nr:tetraacyldisaccharide 4'-kinase [Deltaproteobacteria bacterium]
MKQKVESVMTGEGKAPLISLASALYTISLFYGAGLKLRELAYRRKVMPSRRLPCKVICVGNITVGGTGKTPMAMHVAQEIKNLGYQVAIVSRGYRGGAASRGGIVSDGKSICMGPEQAGDEPYMIARGLKAIPVIVGKNRYAAGMLAVNKFQPDVIVLDDGFQHLRLKRDIDLVLLDYAHPFGNTHLLPRGILREPISSLVRGTACILSRYQADRNDAATTSIDLIKKYTPPGRVFTSSHDPYCYAVKSGQQIPVNGIIDRYSRQEVDGLTKEPIFGFSGIARNADFQNTVKDLGFKANGFLEFSDHHHYTAHDLNDIQSKAENAGARRLITTEKDLVRLSPPNPFPLELIVVGVEVSFGNDQPQFMSFLKKQLSS